MQRHDAADKAAAFVFRGLTVGADEVTQAAVNFRGLLDSAVEHGAPLAGVFVEIDGTEEIAGLEDDFEGVAEVVREAAISCACSIGMGGVPVDSVILES